MANNESDKQASSNWQQTLCTPTAMKEWLGIAALDATHPLMQRYGRACDAMYPLEGIRFSHGEKGFVCMAQINYEPAVTGGSDGGVTAELLGEIFGESVPQSQIMRRDYMVSSQLAVIAFEGGDIAPVTTPAALAKMVTSVSDERGAVALAYLSGTLGAGYQPKAVCNASLETAETGWYIRQADVFVNCQPRESRDVHIGRNGTLRILSQQPQANPDGTLSAICVD